jgi:iron complex outermembrane receptor protein
VSKEEKASAPDAFSSGSAAVATAENAAEIPAEAPVPTSAGAADTKKKEGIEEIVVTATRRSTNLLETPVAVTAVSQNSLTERNITNALEIERVVPNLKIQDIRALGMGSVQFSMRGIGNTNYTEQGDPNVGFHVDSIYVPRSQAVVGFLFDVERIEVLRGPQGTLFGRNSTVGTINIVSAQPKFDLFEGSVEGQLGTYNERLTRAVLNVPILDDFPVLNDLALRLTGFVHRRNSQYELHEDLVWQDNYDYNPYLRLGDPARESTGAGSIDEKGLRAALRWRPVEDFTVTGTYEIFDSHSPVPPLTSRRNPYVAYLDMPHTMDQQIHGLRVAANYELLDSVSFHYYFGDSYYKHRATVDYDSGVYRYRRDSMEDIPEDMFFYDAPWRNDARSHEAQIRSTWDLPVNFLLGFFDFEEITKRNLWIDIPQRAGGILLFNQPRRIARSRAGFGEVSVALLDKFELRGGLRYSKDRKIDENGSRSEAWKSVGGPTFGCAVIAEEYGLTPYEVRNTNFCDINSLASQNRPPNDDFDQVFNNDEEFDSLDWSVTASYTPIDDMLLYGTVATGYKSGGYQDTYYLPRTGEIFFPVLKPEDLMTFEVGAKASLLGGSLRVAGDVYFMIYKNKQESVLANFGDAYCPYTWGDWDGTDILIPT